MGKIKDSLFSEVLLCNRRAGFNCSQTPIPSSFIRNRGYGKADVPNILQSYSNKQDDTRLTWQMSLTAEELGSEKRKASARLPRTKSIWQAPAHPNSGTVDSHFRCVLGKLANCFLNPEQIRNSKLVHFSAYGKMTAVSLTGREGEKRKMPEMQA